MAKQIESGRERRRDDTEGERRAKKMPEKKGRKVRHSNSNRFSPFILKEAQPERDWARPLLQA